MNTEEMKRQLDEATEDAYKEALKEFETVSSRKPSADENAMLTTFSRMLAGAIFGTSMLLADTMTRVEALEKR